MKDKDSSLSPQYLMFGCRYYCPTLFHLLHSFYFLDLVVRLGAGLFLAGDFFVFAGAAFFAGAFLAAVFFAGVLALDAAAVFFVAVVFFAGVLALGEAALVAGAAFFVLEKRKKTNETLIFTLVDAIETNLFLGVGAAAAFALLPFLLGGAAASVFLGEGEGEAALAAGAAFLPRVALGVEAAGVLALAAVFFL